MTRSKQNSRQSLVQCVFLLSLIMCSVYGAQQFVTQPESKSVIENGTVTLQCKVKNRQGSLQWTRDGLGLGLSRDLPGFARYTMIGASSLVGSDVIEDYSLQIMDAQLEDDADFQCQVGATSQFAGIRSNVVKLTVLLPPQRPFIVGAPTIEVKQGVLKNITCKAQHGKPGATIKWYKDNIRISNDVVTRTITFNNKTATSESSVAIIATAGDAGKKIECVAENDALSKPYKTSAILDVQFPPRITLSHNITQNRKIREHQNVRFTCVGTANPFNIKWGWYENGKRIEGEEKNFYDIPNISRDKNKFSIACEGNNTAGRTRVEEILDIEFGPRILDMPTTVGVDVGDKVTLTCRSEGNPPADIIWRRKGYLTKSPLTTSPTYTIERISEDDIGIYTCTASVRTFNDDSRDVYVLLNSAPKIVSNAQQYAAEGSSGKLECKARAVPYPDTIEWTRNNEVITYEGSGKYFEKQETNYDVITSTLTITNTVESDFGQYNCTIVNSRGSDMLTINLIAKDILPLSLIVGGVIGGVATIFFIAIACVVYHRYCKSSDADSYAETDSNTEFKKREKSDSPSDFTNKSTLMDQWRQDLNYHCGTDYEDLYGPKVIANENLNSSGYGTLKSDNIINAYENQNGHPVHLYSDYTHTTGGDPVENKYENGFNTYGTSSFRSTSRTDFSPTYDNSEPYRLPPADISTTKLATNV